MRKILLLIVVLWLLWPFIGHSQVIGVQPTPMGLYQWNGTQHQFNELPNPYSLFPQQSTPQPFAFYGWNSTLHQWTPCDVVTDSCHIGGASFALTTTGTSGPATYDGTTLNIPNYAVGISTVNAGTGLNGGGSGPSVTLNLNTALPNGETATTQTLGDNTTKVATDAFVQAAIGGLGARPWGCQPGFGDGLNSMASGTYLQSVCLNDTGVTVTMSGIRCYTDNNGTSAMNVTNGAGTALLTGPVTCTNAWAAGTQSATVTLANGDYMKFTFVADGTSKQTTFAVRGSY